MIAKRFLPAALNVCVNGASGRWPAILVSVLIASIFSPLVATSSAEVLDVGVTAITTNTPSPAAYSNGREPITITIKNFSSQPIRASAFRVQYQIDAGIPIDQIASAAVPSTVPAFGTSTLKFDRPADLGLVGTHTINARTILDSDVNIGNDSTQITVETLPLTSSTVEITSFPYSENFEAGPGDWTALTNPGLYLGGPSTAFVLGTPTKDYIAGAASGVNSWVTNLSTFYRRYTSAQVVSPIFDLRAIPYAELSLNVAWESELSKDGAKIQYSNNGGVSWTDIGASGEPVNWYNQPSHTGLGFFGGGPGFSGYVTAGSSSIPYTISGTGPYVTSGSNLGSGGYVLSKHVFPGGAKTKLRVVFGADQDGDDEGFAFDDVQVKQALSVAEAVALIIDGDNDGRADPGDRLRFTATISNTSSFNYTNGAFVDSISDLNLTFVPGSVTTSQGSVIVGNGAGDPNPQVNFGTISPNSTVTVTFDVLVALQSNPLALNVCSQGQFAANEISGSVFTDDLSTAAFSDSTCRPAFLDSDNDGVPNTQDICSLGPDNVDTDGDGRPNACDVCQGGDDSIDSDFDNTPNFCDLCPNDGAKIAAGICGCGVPDTDGNANGVPDCIDTSPNTAPDGTCLPGSRDCAIQPLGNTACAVVNGFFGHVNILSLANNQPSSLPFTMTLIDGNGRDVGGLSSSLGSLKKQDFNVNLLGLQPNTVNRLCVTAVTSTIGAWSGAVAIYKPNTRGGGSPVFGLTGFDYVLHRPLVSAFRGLGAVSLPLNTSHFGVDPNALVTNWLSLGDAARGDGKKLTGTMFYYAEGGTAAPIASEPVNIPDGGSQDFNGHLALDPNAPGLSSKLGMAVFVPSTPPGGGTPQFFFEEARYFADCTSPGCTDFLTAFVVGPRPATANLTGGDVSVTNGEVAIVETWNDATAGTITSNAAGSLSVRGEFGDSLGSIGVPPAAHAVKHVVMNKFTDSNNVTTGFVNPNVTAAARLAVSSGKLSAMSVYYKLNDAGVLQYAFSAPFLGGGGTTLRTYYNSFLSNLDSSIVVNTSSQFADIVVDYIDFNGTSIFGESFSVGPNANRRFAPSIPANSYGTMAVTSSANGVAVHNYIRRGDEYAYCSSGR